MRNVQSAPGASVSEDPHKGQYLADFGRLNVRPAPDWLRRVRRAGLAQFEATPWPHHKQEAWRFTDTRPIVRIPFRTALEPRLSALPAEAIRPYLVGEADWTELVFVDGFFAPELSRRPALPEDAAIQGFAEACDAANPVLTAHMTWTALPSLRKREESAFVALNAAFSLDGAFIHLPRGLAMERPVHVVFVTTPGAENRAAHPRAAHPRAMLPRNVVLLEAHSELTLVESHVNLGSEGTVFVNPVTDISIGEGAVVRHVQVIGEGAGVYRMGATRVRQEASSAYSSWCINTSSPIARNELSVTLEGTGAQCRLGGLYMADGECLIDQAISVDHMAPKCTSWLGYKGILEERAHAVFCGKILVRRAAQQTDSEQLNNNLLLSDAAAVDTRPLLEIFADDVKCTHGATVGPPPEEQLFYFRTRAIRREVAQAMMTCGFAGEVIDSVPVAPVRDRLVRFVREKYNPHRGA